MRFPRLIAFRALFVFLLTALPLACAAAAEDPMAPFYGEWRVNFERSYDRAIADEAFAQLSPDYLRDYVAKMGAIMALGITDSLATYSRGNHSKDMTYEVTAASGDTITLRVFADELAQVWQMVLVDEEHMHLESDATPLNDFWIYERYLPGAGPEGEQPPPAR